jgi:hypothetical protein
MSLHCWFFNTASVYCCTFTVRDSFLKLRNASQPMSTILGGLLNTEWPHQQQARGPPHKRGAGGPQVTWPQMRWGRPHSASGGKARDNHVFLCECSSGPRGLLVWQSRGHTYIVPSRETRKCRICRLRNSCDSSEVGKAEHKEKALHLVVTFLKSQSYFLFLQGLMMMSQF